MKFSGNEIKGLKVLIMGLGINGGGLHSALFFAKQGAALTVTDLKTEDVLAPSIEQLKGFSVKYVLGRHDEEDFKNADLVIKNPAVKNDSRYLQAALSRNVPIETDLSIFLSIIKNPVIAVTGSKGKSSTASAVYHVLKAIYPGAQLGGNITINPLSFLDGLNPADPVVLELSSWQLADLKGRGILKPIVSIITNILPDHMNVYSSMSEYIDDKKLIFKEQSPDACTILNYDDTHLQQAAKEVCSKLYFFSSRSLPAGVNGAWLTPDSGIFIEGSYSHSLFKGEFKTPGEHNRLNLLAAALCLRLVGISEQDIDKHLHTFGGVEHRLELFVDTPALKVYNDTAATIPHAVVAALKALKGAVYLITGGTDKNIDFTPLLEVSRLPMKIYLLAGTGTEKIIELFKQNGISYEGPYNDLSSPVQQALKDAVPGSSLILSPGCASFGMFLNEFDRGRKFKAVVKQMLS